MIERNYLNRQIAVDGREYKIMGTAPAKRPLEFEQSKRQGSIIVWGRMAGLYGLYVPLQQEAVCSN